MALIGTFEQKGNSVLKSSKPLIDAFNGETYSMAEKQIYAPNKEFNIFMPQSITNE